MGEKGEGALAVEGRAVREEGFDLLEVGVLIADAGVGADESGFG